MSTGTKKLTEKVADVARRVAVQTNPIVEGTVIGRNPDGSLNVDDGRGGCVRVAPRANVRIGERVKLGTEPSLGGQTNLPQVTLTIEPSTVPCPDDPRLHDGGCEDLIGAPCTPPVDGEFISDAAEYGVEWFTENFLEGFPGTDGVWAARIGEKPDWIPSASQMRVSINRLIFAGSTRRASNFSGTYPGGAPYADRVEFDAQRRFLSFDTTELPANARIIAASLQVPFLGNTVTRIRNDVGSSIVVVPSTHSGGHSVFNWNALGDFPDGDPAGPVLGSARISEIRDAGPDPEDGDTVYPFTFDLSDAGADVLTAAFTAGGITRLALANSYDYLGLTYPTPASFVNLSNPNEIRDVADFALMANDAAQSLYLRLFVSYTTGSSS